MKLREYFGGIKRRFGKQGESINLKGNASLSLGGQRSKQNKAFVLYNPETKL
jgi:hypothetical protein